MKPLLTAEEKRARATARSTKRYHALTPAQRETLRERERASYARNREARRTKSKTNRALRRDDHNAKARAYVAARRELYYEYQAAHRFGVTRADIQAVRATSAVCEICGNPPNAATKRLAIDHCHETGALRGMLCTTCNLGLGAFKDDPAVLYKAFMYLMARMKVVEVA